MTITSRKQRDFRQREEEILTTALTLFLEKGEDNVTVEMIADAVGIGKGTIYKHFRSKAEIYLRLMLDYEQELADLIQSDAVTKDKDALPRAYFEYRMRHPEKYYLFDRLEQKLSRRNPHPELFQQLHKIRASNFSRLSEIIQQRIADGALEDVPPYYHYCAAWALVHGMVAIHHSTFWQNVIHDKEDFFRFMMDIGVRMGNRGQAKPRVQKTEEALDITPQPEPADATNPLTQEAEEPVT
ncbi:TetR/AcrR family transcriptional regulator [Zooshikella marina]|uniref:TetR/AcrR family transcriptional regulator n=1 Tax=Zooshikella ganghwensis TaxID=202772 RepID=A0A4P9VWE5_9GAMM|nr:TetR/AcrR family transcriptional regulator [Zooshikella ganghwensis]MBU2705119.1 TetR/AcrR family transcriptional regulator [Zooshikella ganghwensis]RDH46732.1 TetR/AcrR family transcriptional regulator [Zooshikella ganghwensis]